MSRTTRYKVLYVTALLILGAAATAVLVVTGVEPLIAVLLAVVLLVPGRIQGHLWRDFYRGRRLLGQGKPEEAARYFDRFLDQLAARPWLKKLIWLSWGMYTRDIEVMTRGNLGAAHMLLGQLDTSERHLKTARQLDPECPLPWHNLGVIHQARGDEVAAKMAFHKARQLGFTGGASDQLVRTVGEAYARVEGRGIEAAVEE